MTRKVKLIILLFGFLTAFAAANFVLAADFGVNEVSNGLGGSLTATDPRVLIGRIIQIALSFLGAIAVIIIMYAGFLWTTSAGEEEKITKAKNILKSALIGLVIILSSWGIATFLLTRLSGAINGNGGESFGGDQSGLISSGAGAFGACTIENTYPASGQTDVPRNTSIMITFKEELKLDSVCVNDAGTACTCNKTDCNKINPAAIRLYKTDLGDACSASSCPDQNSNVTDILVTVPSGNKTLVLLPLTPLGSASGNTSYSFKLTGAVKKLDDSSMFQTCNVDYAEWSFTVNNSLDLVPPVIIPAGMFPIPDNEKDVYREITPAKAAVGLITVNAVPQVYSSAAVKTITSSPEGLGATAILNYHGLISKFKIVVVETPANTPNKAQLFSGEDNQTLLGVADFSAANEVTFKDYFTFKTETKPAVGNSWEITISPEKLADTLTVNDTIYTFATSAENNNIKVPEVFNANTQAINIAAKINGLEVEASTAGKIINLTAKVAGTRGNSLTVATTNTNALEIKPLTGGADRRELNSSQGEKDRPMNSVVQVNFNEPINPLTISGSATEVANYVRMVNANASSSPSGTSCAANSDCRSYKCENSVCVGDYLGGKFMVSNNYKTLEFISDKECGVNGCGEKIYCLPANSHLAMEMTAANLRTCSTDVDCAAFNPFKTCSSSPLGYKTCQNSVGKNYPSGNIAGLDGIVDAAVNSLDGDRSTYADGPLDFYDDNYLAAANANKKDKYKWSFYINDQIMLTPPRITAVKPSQGQNGEQVGLADPIEIYFNALMMNSTLRTGSVLINNGTSTFEHKLINLRSSVSGPLGYWVSADNRDTEPLDGEPDLTVVSLSHSPFAESLTFNAQVGSGVKDIYQNCYKPSIGPSCEATAEQPSCCFGSPAGILGADGNCQ